ncbi:hypothetical protein H8959_016593 [Pygathrix nigripes]
MNVITVFLSLFLLNLSTLAFIKPDLRRQKANKETAENKLQEEEEESNTSKVPTAVSEDHL